MMAWEDRIMSRLRPFLTRSAPDGGLKMMKPLFLRANRILCDQILRPSSATARLEQTPTLGQTMI